MGLQKYEHRPGVVVYPFNSSTREEARATQRNVLRKPNTKQKQSVNLSIHQYIEVVGGGIGFQDI